MSVDDTAHALAAITDVGLLERLATAILREVNPVYSTLVHTGVNVDGKTVVSPLDGICFVKSAEPPHMIAVHHTTTARKELQKKWLQDPSKVGPQGYLWVEFSHSGAQRPADLWITSLLPTEPTGSSYGYVDNLPVAHIPTALQISDSRTMNGAYAPNLFIQSIGCNATSAGGTHRYP